MKKLTKEEVNKMLPPGYWDMPAPEKVGDKFFNTATMEWDTVGAIETSTISVKRAVELGLIKISPKSKYFTETGDKKENNENEE